VLPVYLDLLDRGTLQPAVDSVMAAWGRIDVLVNNGRYVGPGHMDQILDTPVELLDRHLEANVMAPVVLAKLVLPMMVERGGGVIINLASTSGTVDPASPAGQGGWGLGYGMSKGALHRMAGILAVELGDRGIRAYNLSPGFVATERIALDMAEFGFDATVGAPPDVVGAAAAWLVTSPEAAARNGEWIEAQDLCRQLGLLPGWPPPKA
jgi:NAD(P)-dependent dehydrogenase (short-subunit alcohol dehydrogenase family)